VKISSKDKKVLIAGAVIVAAVAIFYTLTSYMPNPKALSVKIDGKRKMINRDRENLMREPALRQQIEQYNKRFEQDMTRLLPGDNSSVAGAELLKLLKDIADANGVNITTRSNLSDKKMQGLTKVSARIETSCDMEQLVTFLAAIENYPRFLKIEELMITSFRIQAQKKYEIRPGMTVAGYIRSREEKQVEKPAVAVGTGVR
jgi:Tfp pilus assembly protein PilO